MESADKKFFILVCAILCCACNRPIFGPAVQEIRTFSGSNCQDALRPVPFEPGISLDLQQSRTLEDNRICSLELCGLRNGDVIEMYDDPEGNTDSSWARITVRSHITDYCVSDLENDPMDGKVQLIYYGNSSGGLSGKVSFIKMTREEGAD